MVLYYGTAGSPLKCSPHRQPPRKRRRCQLIDSDEDTPKSNVAKKQVIHITDSDDNLSGSESGKDTY